jgi:hypothetical protein
LLDDGRGGDGTGTIATIIAAELARELKGRSYVGAGAFVRVDDVRAAWATFADHPLDVSLFSQAAFRKKSAEWCNAGAGSDHDHGSVTTGRWSESRVGVDVDADLAGGQGALGQKGGTGSLASTAIFFVAHGADGKMDLARVGLGRR